jgi:predicted homoserine dehydrogenase-like protein
LLHNTATPRLSVAALAKHDLAAGTRVGRGCGGFELRGSAVRIADRPDHLPIGLADSLRLRRRIAAGDILTVDDVELEHDADLLALWDPIVAAAGAARASG